MSYRMVLCVLLANGDRRSEVFASLAKQACSLFIDSVQAETATNQYNFGLKIRSDDV